MLAESSFPFILDKMTATQIETKKECLALLQKMFSLEGYAQGSESQYLQIVHRHVPPAVNLLMNEYFNIVDEETKKMTAETLALILKR